MLKVQILFLLMIYSGCNIKAQIISIINQADKLAKETTTDSLRMKGLKKEIGTGFDFVEFKSFFTKKDSTKKINLYYRNNNHELLKIEQCDRHVATNNRDFYFHSYKDYIIYFCYLYESPKREKGDWIFGFFLYDKIKKINYFFGTREPFVNQYSFKLYELLTIMELDSNLYPEKQLKITDGKILFKTIYNYENKALKSEYVFYFLEDPSLTLSLSEIGLKEIEEIFQSTVYDNYLGKVKPDIVNNKLPVWINPLYKYD